MMKASFLLPLDLVLVLVVFLLGPFLVVVVVVVLMLMCLAMMWMKCLFQTAAAAPPKAHFQAYSRR